ncbi:hypothetical protein [Agrobacterium rubi]|uniref:DUF3072 domain-containing protein n=1 Tax=Agrobacterium rubi TaxID=28099 RepID=A0ABX2J387_9HYPH|nr:hypothetical protein [Agrobacterium rubi]NTF35561.1 hypothetical protein [Agrobacterium rubi]
MTPDTRRQIAELEARRPDPEKQPEEFARINQEISALIDEERAFQRASKGFRVS